ncbi:MAG TPA: hypothetical protein VHP63_01240 [candidate division Zixibacteria bacterium]|nr:hypothetical protein [candidate division Zixibacteria bacterium]
MKKCAGILFVVSLVVWIGCSSTDDSANPAGPSPSGTLRVVANDTIGAPTMSSVNEPVWGFIAKYAIDLSTSIAPRPALPEALNVPDSIYIQAINDGIGLYLRIEWADDSLNLLKDYLETINGTRTFAVRDFSQEDQLFVMFAGLPDSAYDVWNWRSLTTSPAGLAEGCIFRHDSLISDFGDSLVAKSNINPNNSTEPIYVHSTGDFFTGQILYESEIDTFTNHSTDFTTAGEIVPGWIIDSSLGSVIADSLGSRWDVFTLHNYDPIANRQTVVLKSKLKNFITDDLILADSVKIRIGILDDQADLTQGGSRRGFTQEFWLILNIN